MLSTLPFFLEDYTNFFQLVMYCTKDYSPTCESVKSFNLFYNFNVQLFRGLLRPTLAQRKIHKKKKLCFAHLAKRR